MVRGKADSKGGTSNVETHLRDHGSELRLPQFLEITSKPRHELMRHPIYQIDQECDIRIFMQSHVFAVWDFMTILKTLQQRFTCVATPWMPTHDPHAARLINEIVLEEESDCLDADGIYLSHFDIYRAAMTEVGADLTPINSFIASLTSGKTVDQALRRLSIPSDDEAVRPRNNEDSASEDA